MIISMMFSYTFFAEAAGVNIEPVEGFNFWPTNVEVDAMIDDTVAFSGNSSYKVTNHTPKGSMKYFIVNFSAPVVAGENYVFGGEIKAEDMAADFTIYTDFNDRISLKPFGNTFDWKHFELEYVAEKTQEVSVSIMIEGTGTAWFDDMFFKNKNDGVNMVQNAGFERAEAELPQENEGNGDISIQEPGDLDIGDFEDETDYQNKLNALKSADSFTLEDAERFNNIGAVPLYKAEGITTDASGGGWEKYDGFVMSKTTCHYVKYIEGPSDITGEVKLAYDDNSLYIHAVVNDDIFCPLRGTNDYWKGDGLQIAFSEDKVFGREIGAAFDNVENRPRLYSEYLTDEDLQECSVEMKVEEGRQIYDIVVPWKQIFSARPERFRFNIAFNDNDDGENRHDCIEITDGILLRKSSEANPIMELMTEGKDWYTWLEAPEATNIGEKMKSDLYIVNHSEEEKSFNIESVECGVSQELTVPPKTGVRYEFDFIGETSGNHSFNVSISSGDNERVITQEVSLSYALATTEEAESLLSDLIERRDEIGELIEQCKAKGLSTDYETISWRVMGIFTQNIREEINSGILYRIAYYKECFDEIYADTKADLESYISGEKEPLAVPKYITSDIEVDGTSIWADTIYNGEIEKRPVFLNGYLYHHTEKTDALSYLTDVGVSSVQMETKVTEAIQDPGVLRDIGNVWPNGSWKGEYGRTDEEAYEGTYSYKMTDETPLTANTYLHVRLKSPELKPNTTYTYSFMAKAVSASGLTWSVGGGSNGAGNHTISGTSDWTAYSQTFTTGNETERYFDFILNNLTTAIYFDNFTLTEEGTDANLFEDGGFEFIDEEAIDRGYYINHDAFEDIVERLEILEENNIGITLLLSPHYYPDWLFEKFPDTYMQSLGFNKVNFWEDTFKEIIETYLRVLMPKIKDFTCINSIVVANELQCTISSKRDFYKGYFQAWLEEKWGTIDAFNEATGYEYAGFDDIEFMESWQDKDPIVTEYDEFNDYVLATFCRFMVNIIHEYMPDVTVQCKIMDYTQDFWDVHQYAYQVNGTNFDTMSTVFDINGCDAYSYYDWEHNPLIKMQWYDYMAGIKWAPGSNTEDHILRDSGMNYDRNLAKWCANDIWQGAVHYRGITDIWLWGKREDQVETKGSILVRPDALVKVGETNWDLNRLSYEITALQNEPREVGILYSNASAIHSTSYPSSQYYAYESAVYSGQKVWYITENQIENIHQTKVLLVPQCEYVKPQTIVEIKKYIQNGGKVVIIGTNSLRSTEHFKESDKTLVDYIYENASSVVDVTGDRYEKELKTGSVEDIYTAVNNAVEEAGIQYVKVVDAQTGEEIRGIEYQSTVYDGKLLVNIANWDPEERADKKIKILAYGEEITGFTELRSMERIEGDIIAKYLEPILLCVDWDRSNFLDAVGHWAEADIDLLYREGLVSGISDTRYAPDRVLTRAEFLALLTRAEGLSASYRNQIADVSVDAWYADAVAAALEAGIIDRSDFRPDDIITRDEMAGLLIKALELKKGELTEGISEFTDSDEIINKNAVNKAVNLRLLEGFDDGSFRPSAGLTRAEAASLFVRYLEL